MNGVGEGADSSFASAASYRVPFLCELAGGSEASVHLALPSRLSWRCRTTQMRLVSLQVLRCWQWWVQTDGWRDPSTTAEAAPSDDVPGRWGAMTTADGMVLVSDDVPVNAADLRCPR